MSAPEAVEQTLIIEAGAEARVAGLLRERGARKVLLLAMPHHRDGAERISAALGPLSAGIFDEVAQHVPVELAEKARARVRETGADWVVAHGGGTVIGFAKAIALTEDVQLCAIPTTYSGSERTGIWGLRGPEGKETGRDPRVRPALVVYDPELTVGLPQKLSLTSLMNAMAHALSALWRPSPGAAGEAEVDEAVGTLEALLEGFAAIAADPTDVAARAAALRGSARAGAFIERVPLGMQHLLAHVLGGTFGASHSDAHTAVLSYATGFNGAVTPEAMARLRPLLGEDPPAALYDLARAHDLPHSLKQLGITHDDLPRLVSRALARAYDNVRPYDEAVLTELVSDAYHARRPSLLSRRRALGGSGPHAALLATERGAPLAEAKAVIIGVHGRGASADRLTRDLEASTGLPPGLTLLAPQALDNAWYPKGFTVPLADNQPWLDSALSMLDAAWEAAREVVPAEQICMAAFSQGACLLLSWARSRGVSPGALLAFSGAHLDVAGDYANLAGSRVYLSKSEGDPWIPADRFEDTVAALRAANPEVQVHVEPGAEHRIHERDGRVLARVVGQLLG